MSDPVGEFDPAKLTVLGLIQFMTEHGARSVTLELEGAPCVVEVTLKFPEPAKLDESHGTYG